MGIVRDSCGGVSRCIINLYTMKHFIIIGICAGLIAITVISDIKYGIDFWGWIWIILCLALGLVVGIDRLIAYRRRKK